MSSGTSAVGRNSAATASSTTLCTASFWSITTRWAGEEISTYRAPKWSAHCLLTAAGTMGSSDPWTKTAGTSQRLTRSAGSKSCRMASPASAEARLVAPNIRLSQSLVSVLACSGTIACADRAAKRGQSFSMAPRIRSYGAVDALGIATLTRAPARR